MGDLLEGRRQHSTDKLETLRQKLVASETKLNRRACVYITGSFGRREASRYSDLDLFVLGDVDPPNTKEDEEKPSLSRLDEITLLADLIRASAECQFPPFSGDGEYLKHYTISDLTKTLGRPDDDALNTFTARLLLVLESYPLLGGPFYTTALDEVIRN